MKAAAAVVLGALALQIGGGMPAGNRAHREGRYGTAAREYERAMARGDSSAAARYNLGTALLRGGRHVPARAHLEAAARLEGSDELKSRASYNAGNADLETVVGGQVREQERRAALERAVANYKRALLAAPGDADAKWNLELAQRLLEEERRNGGGGGEDDEKDEGGGGNQDKQPPQPASPQAQQAPNPSPGERPMSREEAERLLTSAEESERHVQRDVLERQRRDRRTDRDW